MNFFSVDVETANESYASICQIGIACFADSQYVDGLLTLVNPNDYFLDMNVSLHGINEDMVIDAPLFEMLYPTISELLSNQVVVCHSPFDRVSLNRACDAIGAPHIACRWLDTACVVRRAFPDQRSGLRHIAKHLEIDFIHHNALEDARCAGEILCRSITYTEITLDGWFDRVKKPIRDHVDVTVNEDGSLRGEILVFTGALSMTRGEAAQLAAAAGCEVNDGVTKHTTILVVGDQDVRRLNGADVSSKHAKARELVKKGKTIRIITESDFTSLLALAN